VDKLIGVVKYPVIWFVFGMMFGGLISEARTVNSLGECTECCFSEEDGLQVRLVPPR
jgi:H+/gluconate symporter-like permease